LSFANSRAVQPVHFHSSSAPEVCVPTHVALRILLPVNQLHFLTNQNAELADAASKMHENKAPYRNAD
jgi:hypothetical protein